MAYFDNAATTYPKPECVYQYMDKFYRECGGNAGRGNYEQAKSAGELIANTRSMIQDLLHCPTKQVVFEPTARKKRRSIGKLGFLENLFLCY